MHYYDQFGEAKSAVNESVISGQKIGTRNWCKELKSGSLNLVRIGLNLLPSRLFEIVMCSFLKWTVEAVQVKQKGNHDKKITIRKANPPSRNHGSFIHQSRYPVQEGKYSTLMIPCRHVSSRERNWALATDWTALASVTNVSTHLCIRVLCKSQDKSKQNLYYSRGTNHRYNRDLDDKH